MRVGDKNYQTIWIDRDGKKVNFIDQTKLPYEFSIVSTNSANDLTQAIKSMQVRGAPVIGVCGALAFTLGIAEDASNELIEILSKKIIESRPTAVNLLWAVNRIKNNILNQPVKRRANLAWDFVEKLMQEDIQSNIRIGEIGAALIHKMHKNKNRKLNILTHCNAGWLATVDFGTALSPIFNAHLNNDPIHIWVDETRPRNQGLLTCWELNQYSIPNTLIVDNAGGYLMREGEVDMVIVGADRISLNGHVCNKIGTYLKALAAKDNNIPFYVAAPRSTIDRSFIDQVNFDIENRDPNEITKIRALSDDGKLKTVNYPALDVSNPAFDITPSHLISGIITEAGVISSDNLKSIL